MVKDTKESLVAFCEENNRVCPYPFKWAELYEKLLEGIEEDNVPKPPIPVVCAAWTYYPQISRTIQLMAQIEWADKYGRLDKMSRYLRRLKEKDWFHGND